jgi:hypothetical protein
MIINNFFKTKFTYLPHPKSPRPLTIIIVRGFVDDLTYIPSSNLGPNFGCTTNGKAHTKEKLML